MDTSPLIQVHTRDSSPQSHSKCKSLILQYLHSFSNSFLCPSAPLLCVLFGQDSPGAYQKPSLVLTWTDLAPGWETQSTPGLNLNNDTGLGPASLSVYTLL